MIYPNFDADMHGSLGNPYAVTPFMQRNEEEKQESSLTWGESLNAAWTGAAHGITTYAPERFYRAFRSIGRFVGSTDLESWADSQIANEIAARESDEWYRPDPKWMESEWGKALYEGFSNFTSGTITMLPGAAAALAAAPLTGGASLGLAFTVGAAGSAGVSGLSEFDSFLDDAYRELSETDPAITKEMIYGDKFWGAAISGVAEGGMSLASDVLTGKLAGVIGKPAAGKASHLLTRFIKNTTTHMASELGEEAATAYVQDWAREVNGMDYQGRWEAIKNIVGPTLVAGGLGAAQNTVLGHGKEAAAAKSMSPDEGTKTLIERHTLAKQREALSEQAMTYMQGLQNDGVKNAFEAALMQDKLANRWAAETGRDKAEFFSMQPRPELGDLASAASDVNQTFDGVVDNGASFLWNSLDPALQEAVRADYASQGVEFTTEAMVNDFKAWIREGDKAFAESPLSEQAKAGFTAMRDTLVDSVGALSSQSTATVSKDTLAVLDKAIGKEARKTQAVAPSVTRDSAAMDAVMAKYADVKDSTPAQTAEFLREAAGTLNLDMLAEGAPKDIHGMFAQYSKALEPVFKQMQENGKVRKDANVNAQARMMFENNPDIKSILDTFNSALGMDAKIAAVEMIIEAADANMKTVAERALVTGSPEDILQARILAERVVAMQKVSKGIGSEQGRAFRMRRFNKKDPRFAEQVMAGLSAYGRQDANEAFLTALVNAKDQGERMRVADIPASRRGLDALVEYVTGGMLFGPSTHVVNAVSNAVQGINEVVTRAYAGWTNGKAPGGVMRGEAQQMLLGIWPAFGEIRRIWRDHRAGFQAGAMETGRALEDSRGMWKNTGDNTIASDAGHMGRAISRETADQLIGSGKQWLGMSKEHGVVSGGLSTAVEYLGRFLNMPFIMLEHSDQVFKTVFKSMELNAQIYRAAAGNPEVMARMHKNPPTDLVQKSEQFAKRVTFQDDLGKVGQNINAIRNEMPLTRLLLPFLKTPINIYKEGARMTPGLNFFFKDIRNDLRSQDAATRQLSEAKLMVGSLIWGSAMMAAGAGLLTGPGPEDPDEKKKLLATGWRPNALKINGDYYAIDRLDPLAAVFNSAAFLVEIKDHIQTDDLETAMMTGLGQSLRLLTDRTYIESFSDAMQLLTNFERAAPNMQRRLGGMLVPASALARTINREDPFQREADGFWDALKQNVPGMSASMPIRRDFLGQPVKSLEYAAPAPGTSWFSPIQVGRNNDDPVYQEVARLQQAGFKAAPMPNRRISATGNSHKMNGEQYSRFLDLYGNEKVNGKTAHQALQKLMSSPRYQKLGDEGKAEAAKALLSGYQKHAKSKIIGENENIRKALDVKSKGIGYLLGM